MKEISKAAFMKKVLRRQAERAYMSVLERARPEIEATGFTVDHALTFGMGFLRAPTGKAKPAIQHLLARHAIALEDAGQRKLASRGDLENLVALELGTLIVKAVASQVSGPEEFKEKPIAWWSHKFTVQDSQLRVESVFEEDKYAAYQFRQAVAP